MIEQVPFAGQNVLEDHGFGFGELFGPIKAAPRGCAVNGILLDIVLAAATSFTVLAA